MSLSYLALAAVGLTQFVSVSHAGELHYKPCPLYGANYPAPSNLAAEACIQQASSSLRSQLNDAFQSPSSFGQLDPNTTAFSVEVYSLHQDNPLFTMHFTPDYLKSQRTEGVEAVDEDTIYRIGSVSKLYTVYMYLIAAGDDSWNLPITNFVAELAAISSSAGDVEDNVDQAKWNSITMGALASQLAGISRDSIYSPALAQLLGSMNIPDQGGSAHSTCGSDSWAMLPCNRTDFFEGFPTQHPVTTPFNTPIYSNAAFQILGYALENITGQSIPELMQSLLIDSLGLTSTSYTVPAASNASIIPFNGTWSWWSADAGDESPAGGYFSSLRDVSTLGKAILNSTLLSPAQTRRWLKPHSFTANADELVGAPWEILRAPGDPLTYMYTKSGDIGKYASMTALWPEFDAGFSVLAAGQMSADTRRIISDTIAAVYTPALRDAAKREAMAVYTGTYANEESNSTITIVVDDENPGLVVSEFIGGGQDVLALLGQVQGVDTTSQSLRMNLYYSGLKTQSDNGSSVAWRAVYEALPEDADPGSFSSNCVSWGLVNSLVYGGIGLDEILFTFDSQNRSANGIIPRVLGTNMARP
ncbi:beta-lactamase/transpeptidase-like protein [Xylariaceae sp. FL0016]|nr:beta-lactamase/transpeptidase-like protein [Xylariaceae sp. FL0016]